MTVRRATIPGGGVFGQNVQNAVFRLAQSIDDAPMRPYGAASTIIRSDMNVNFDRLVIVDPTNGALVLTLPRGNLSDIGRAVTVVNMTSDTTNITVDAPNGLIDGSQSQTFGVAWSLRQFLFLGRDDSNNDIWIMAGLE